MTEMSTHTEAMNAMQSLHHGGSTGLEEIEMGATRIQVDDKRIINCRADLNNWCHLNTNGRGKNI